MPSPAPTYENNLVLVAQQFVREGAPHPMYVTYAVDDNVGAGSEVAYANFLQDAFGDNFKSTLDSDALLGECFIKIGDGSTVPRLAVSDAGTISGTRAGSFEPPSTCFLVSKRTAYAGRENRGRFYLPWMLLDTEVDEVGGITSGAVSSLQTHVNAWKTQVEAGTATLVIANRTMALNPTPPPITYVSEYRTGFPITSLIVDDVIASQRRRVRD